MQPSFVPNLVTETLAYVSTHLTERLTVAQLAQRYHLPQPLFSRRFKTVSGQSPSAVLLYARLARAHELLTTSDEPLARIAALAGFCDQSHFTQAFRQHYGVTPGEYRATQQDRRAVAWVRVCALWPQVSPAVQAQVLAVLEAAQGGPGA
jgi:transcriptional regulator GlxA family with amidase domain